MSFFTLSSGENLFYEVSGEGEPVLLIPPATSDHTTFYTLTKALLSGKPSREGTQIADPFKVINIDNLCSGQSDFTTDLTITSMAENIAELLESIDVKSVHVVGVSMGSAIAQELALCFPELVKSLHLNCTWGKSDDWTVRMAEHQKYLAQKLPFEDYVKFNLPFLASVPFNDSKVKADGFISMSKLNKYKPTPDKLIKQWEAIEKHDTINRLSHIKCPVLVSAGEKDRFLPLEYSENVADNIPYSTYYLFKGKFSSHILILELAQEFNEVTLNFLKDLK